MDCKTARLLLTFLRPESEELDPRESQALDSHLRSCADCRSAAAIEHRREDRIRAAMSAVPVPAGLRAEILTRLEGAAQERARSGRRRRIQVFAAAAAVLLALGLVGSWWLRARAPLELELVLADAQQLPASAEQASEWFAAKYGLRTVAPADFNYAYLAAWSLGTVQGQRVPELLFVRGSAYARVYVLSGRQFDLNQAIAAQRVSSGGFTVELRPHPGDENLAYMVVYRGDSLEPFLLDLRQGGVG